MNICNLVEMVKEKTQNERDEKKYYDTHIFENKSYEFSKSESYRSLYENSSGLIIGADNKIVEELNKIRKLVPFSKLKSAYGHEDFCSWFEKVAPQDYIYRYHLFIESYFRTETLFTHNYDLNKYLREMQQIRPAEITKALNEISEDGFIIGYRACSCGQNAFSNSFSINPIATYKTYSKVNPVKFFNKYIIEARIPLNNIVGFGGKQAEEIILLDKFNIQVTKIRNVSYIGYKKLKECKVFK